MNKWATGLLALTLLSGCAFEPGSDDPASTESPSAGQQQSLSGNNGVPAQTVGGANGVPGVGARKPVLTPRIGAPCGGQDGTDPVPWKGGGCQGASARQQEFIHDPNLVRELENDLVPSSDTTATTSTH